MEQEEKQSDRQKKRDDQKTGTNSATVTETLELSLGGKEDLATSERKDR